MLDRRKLVLGAAVLPLAAASARSRDPAWPRSLTMGTAAPGGTYAVYGPAWGQLVQEATGIALGYRTTQGPNQNIVLLQRGEIDLGMATLGVALQAWQGKGDWTEGRQFRDVRALFPMYDTPFHGVALRRSGIARMADLAGKSVGVGPRRGTPGTYLPAMLNALGIRVARVSHGSAGDMAGQLQDGLLDAVLFAAGAPVPAFAELDAQAELSFLDFTEAEVARLTRAFPELTSGTLPADTYRGAGRELLVVGMFNFAIAHRALADDLVHEIVGAVLGGASRLAQAVPAARETIVANAAKNRFLPFHPGAARYLREQGAVIPDSLVMA